MVNVKQTIQPLLNACSCLTISKIIELVQKIENGKSLRPVDGSKQIVKIVEPLVKTHLTYVITLQFYTENLK